MKLYNYDEMLLKRYDEIKDTPIKEMSNDEIDGFVHIRSELIIKKEIIKEKWDDIKSKWG